MLRTWNDADIAHQRRINREAEAVLGVPAAEGVERPQILPRLGKATADVEAHAAAEFVVQDNLPGELTDGPTTVPAYAACAIAEDSLVLLHRLIGSKTKGFHLAVPCDGSVAQSVCASLKLFPELDYADAVQLVGVDAEGKCGLFKLDINACLCLLNKALRRVAEETGSDDAPLDPNAIDGDTIGEALGDMAEEKGCLVPCGECEFPRVLTVRTSGLKDLTSVTFTEHLLNERGRYDMPFAGWNGRDWELTYNPAADGWFGRWDESDLLNLTNEPTQEIKRFNVAMSIHCESANRFRFHFEYGWHYDETSTGTTLISPQPPGWNHADCNIDDLLSSVDMSFGNELAGLGLFKVTLQPTD